MQLMAVHINTNNEIVKSNNPVIYSIITQLASCEILIQAYREAHKVVCGSLQL